MVLPITAMVIGGFATLTFLTKNSFLEEIHKQYVLTARAKGLVERRVLYGHVFRNAMLIVIAGFPAAFIGVLFTGSLLIEVIFSLDGIGLLGFEAALNRDYPVMFGTLYFFGLLGLLIGLIGDLHVHARRSAHRLRGARADDAFADPSARSPVFRANRRGTDLARRCSAVLFLLSLFAELLANDRPILIRYDGAFYLPMLRDYPETTFGGDFPTNAVYTDPEVAEADRGEGLDAVAADPLQLRHRRRRGEGRKRPAAAVAGEHLLGTDDQARDVLARLIYGFRISVLFGLVLTILSSIIGIAAGAVQGYFGGWVDLLFQRFLEIWSSMPTLYLLIILASFIQPGFWVLLGIMLLFSWMALVGLVRAEFLRGRNFDYVRAARALGMLDARIMFRHILPNAMTASLTFLPFILAGSVTTLTALDFLGFGLPPGSPSLGELLLQGKNNLNAPWLAFTGFVVIALMMSLLVFIGEAVRDAFNPRKVLA